MDLYLPTSMVGSYFETVDFRLLHKIYKFYLPTSMVGSYFETLTNSFFLSDIKSLFTYLYGRKLFRDIGNFFLPFNNNLDLPTSMVGSYFETSAAALSFSSLYAAIYLPLW